MYYYRRYLQKTIPMAAQTALSAAKKVTVYTPRASSAKWPLTIVT